MNPVYLCCMNVKQEAMKTQPRFTEVCLLDICLPDYFSGYSYPVIAIPVHEGMTNSEVSEEIQSEINATWDYLTSDGHGFTEDEIKLFDQYCEDLKNTQDPVVIFSPGNIKDNDNDMHDSVYMYFSLCKPVHKYGMTFLND